PRLERLAAEASGADTVVKVVTHDETDDAFALVAGLVRDALQGEPGAVGFANHMWAEHVLPLSPQPPAARPLLARAVLNQLRICKSPDEVEGLRRAGAAIDAVHSRMGEWLKAGRSERAVGRDIADAIIDAGHVAVNFVIVASGPNAASPHHHLSERV